MAEKNLEISVLCDIYAPLLPDKQRMALEYYYDEDLSLAEIAEHAGISRQGVRDQIKHAENQLIYYEDALGLYEKSKKTDEIINKLEKIAHELDSKPILGLAEQLRKLYE